MEKGSLAAYLIGSSSRPNHSSSQASPLLEPSRVSWLNSPSPFILPANGRAKTVREAGPELRGSWPTPEAGERLQPPGHRDAETSICLEGPEGKAR